MPPLLSACIIARNAAGTLGDTLASLAGVADETVVVDTGSTDDTVAVARAAGARIEHFKWIDDFSAAVNHAVRQCRLPWVFNLDSDETLMAHSVKEVTALLQRDDLFAATVLRRDLVDLEDRRRYSRMRQLRLFRNDPRLKYRGRIHRQFVPSADDLAARDGRVVAHSEVEIEHVGYAGDQPLAKRQRNARHMELELADRPDQFYFLVELGRTYALLNDPVAVPCSAARPSRPRPPSNAAPSPGRCSRSFSNTRSPPPRCPPIIPLPRGRCSRRRKQSVSPRQTSPTTRRWCTTAPPPPSARRTS